METQLANFNNFQLAFFSPSRIFLLAVQFSAVQRKKNSFNVLYTYAISAHNNQSIFLKFNRESIWNGFFKLIEKGELIFHS